MKKVRKIHIGELLRNFCGKFISYIRENENAMKTLEIYINSVYIKVQWDLDADVSEEDIDISAFERKIEAITFGNLKVIDCGVEENLTGNKFAIYIANAYDVIE